MYTQRRALKLWIGLNKLAWPKSQDEYYCYRLSDHERVARDVRAPPVVSLRIEGPHSPDTPFYLTQGVDDHVVCVQSVALQLMRARTIKLKHDAHGGPTARSTRGSFLDSITRRAIIVNLPVIEWDRTERIGRPTCWGSRVGGSKGVEPAEATRRALAIGYGHA